MVFLWMFAGFIVGGVLWEWEGALAVAFFTGLVVWSVRALKAPGPVVQRMEGLEKRLAALEASMASAAVSKMAQPQQPIAEPAQQEPQAQREEPAPAPVEAPTPAKAPEPAAPPEPPKPPPKPNFIIAWFTGGNTIVRVGLVVLFLGLAFLVKYSVDHQLLPVELRVAGVAAAGVVLLVIGWRLRSRRREYALSFQGAGVAVLYLTIFGALRLYHLLPPALAFFLLVAIAAFSAMIAVAQDSLALAVFAASGGFLAPILASTGQGSHVMLFSYYLVLNATIVAIAWFKAWRVLNLVGFVFTALIGLAWGVRSYRDELFDTTEPFLIAFFLVYVTIAILFARQQVAKAQRYVDGTIVFGTPIFAFGLQAAMMKGVEFGLAWSSLALAIFYIGAAWILLRAGRDRWKLLAEAFLAMGVVFGSLAIPLALDARWTSAAWALEGAAVFWIGIRQDRKLARAFAILLQAGAGIAFMDSHGHGRMPSGPPLADAVFIGAMILAAAGLWTHRFMGRSAVATRLEKALSPFVFLWSLAWLLGAGGHEIETFVTYDLRYAAWIAFLAAVTLAYGMAGKRFAWSEGSWPALAFVPILFVFATIRLGIYSHPFANFGWLAWAFAIGTHFWLAARGDLERYAKWNQVLHAAGAVLIAFVGALELEWLAIDVTTRGTAWALASRIIVPALVMLVIASRAADTRWPVSAFKSAYRLGAVAALAVAMALWSLHVNLSHAGGSEPLPYLPILNALDLAHVAALIALVCAALAIRRSNLTPPAIFTAKPTIVIGTIIAFVWANSMLLRAIHHWAGVPYRMDALWRSVLVQASLSIFWAFLALALMVIATRKGKRAIWMVGAALMAVVLAKMVFVDLSHLSGIERIVSFIGVGVLMLVIGYFSPVPPRKKEAAQ